MTPVFSVSSRRILFLSFQVLELKGVKMDRMHFINTGAGVVTIHDQIRVVHKPDHMLQL